MIVPYHFPQAWAGGHIRHGREWPPPALPAQLLLPRHPLSLPLAAPTMTTLLIMDMCDSSCCDMRGHKILEGSHGQHLALQLQAMR